MDQIKQTVNALDTKVSDVLKFIEKPTFVKGLVYLSLMLYAARIAPVPPKAVLTLFENVYFKLFVFSLILWTAQISPSTSILIALAFMVTINYTTSGKIWEMMDDVSGSVSGSVTPTPTAPSQAIAMQAASNVIADQTKNSTIVTNVAQNPNTMVITPTVVQTPQGPTVVNPSVVVSSAVVSTPAGQQVVVTPSVTTISPNSSVVTAPANPVTPEQSAEAIKTLAKAASSPDASDATAVNNVAAVAMANASTANASTAIQQLAQQSAIPVSGDAVKVESAKQAALAGCYPMRNYDMTKVQPNIDGKWSFEDYQTFTATQ